MNEYEHMVDDYGWPEPVVDDEDIFESSCKHLPFLRERVSDVYLELVGERVDQFIFTYDELRGGYYDAVNSTIYIHCEHDGTEHLQDGEPWRAYSPIIHEVGHAIHDSHGVSLFNDDYHGIDNRSKSRSEWVLGIVESNEFSSQAITLWESFRQRNMPPIMQYQERNISEFITVAFEQWVAKPTLLIHEQPSMVRFFDTWVGETDTMENYECDCSQCSEDSVGEISGSDLIVALSEIEKSVASD